MKKDGTVLILVTMCILMAKAVEGETVGIPFSISEAFSVGARIHISDHYAIQPSVGFFIGEGVSSTLALGIGNLFYLFENRSIDHYLGGDLFYLFAEPQNSLEIAGYYGLQYPIADVLHIFAELGVFLNIQPAIALSTFKTGIGVVFYPY